MTPTYSQLCTVSSSVDIFAEYIQVWDQNSLSYGVRSQAFFDVVFIALRHVPTRDDSYVGLLEMTQLTRKLSIALRLILRGSPGPTA